MLELELAPELELEFDYDPADPLAAAELDAAARTLRFPAHTRSATALERWVEASDTPDSMARLPH